MKPYRNDMRFLLPMTMLFVSVFTVAQTSFDPKGGCLNVIDFSFGRGIGEYGDRCSMLVHSLEINIGVCFQFKGW